MKFFSLIFLSLISIFGFSQVLTKKDLDDLRSMTASACFSKQKNSAINNSITDAQLRIYCSCYANTLITSDVTAQDLQRVYELGQIKGEDEALKIFLHGRDYYSVAYSCGQQAQGKK